MEPAPEPGGLGYSQRLYANVVDWYKVSETKAQILLTLDGVLATLLVGSVLREPAAAEPILQRFGPETWLSAGLVALSLSVSITCALVSLVARVMRSSTLDKTFGALVDGDGRARPETLWFFQTISKLGEEEYRRAVAEMTPEIEERSLSSQNWLLSGKVLDKLKWLNFGFAAAAVALIALLATAASYLVRVQLGA